MSDVYKKLASHLDKTPAGFPATASGIELKILKRLFTPEEAEITMSLNLLPEPVSDIAKRMECFEEELSPVLESMSKKGLIFRSTKGEQKYYMTSPFIVGIWEYQLKRLTPELIQEVNQYMPEFMKKSWLKHKTKQLRVIPISQEVAEEGSLMTYEVAEEIIKMQSKIVITECICRKEHQMMGKGCDNILEGCFSFGNGAWFYEENGMGRAIDQDEALSILEKGRQDGLVLQAGNAQKSVNICMCCGCCCQILGNSKKMAVPADHFHTNFYAEVNSDECVSCEDCLEKCHMDAITIDDVAIIDMKRCIGCGVCVPDCPTDALSLKQKEPDERYVPAGMYFETLMAMAGERGNI